MNNMKEVRIGKLTLNIGVGAPGEKLDKAVKLLQSITGQKPTKTTTTKRIPTWSIRPGLQIATKVTLRGKKAEKLIVRLLKAKSNILKENSFDDYGNISIGIPEYLDIPDVEYDMAIGIIGLEASISLEKKGYRIKRRIIQKRKVSKKHQVTKQEAIEFMTNKFKIKIE